jgi:hypothetical protein
MRAKRLTVKQMKGLLTEILWNTAAQDVHDKDCPHRLNGEPIDLCACNCFEFALMQGGAILEKGV